MSTTPRFKDKQALMDPRKFHFGEVWMVLDELIDIPQVDHIGQRLHHHQRAVVVISNNTENHQPFRPTITVAPLSHRVDLRKDYDLELSVENDSVKKPSLLQLNLSQPILKKDLSVLKGSICEEKKVELQVLLEDYYGLVDEEE